MRKLRLLAALLLLGGCAGQMRGCSNYSAETFGGDWIVAQYRMDGTPFHCWYLPRTSITNEHSSDGIYWADPRTGVLTHISGWYNRVLINSSPKVAGDQIGIDATKCSSGEYPSLNTAR